MHRPVLSKAQFARRYKAGEFGNHSPTFDTLDECLAFDRFGTEEYDLWHIRNRVAGGKTYYNVPWTELDREWHQLTDKSLWYISAMAPTRWTLFQGEVAEGPLSVLDPPGLCLYYSTVAKPMRESLAEGGRVARGIIGSFLLNHFLPPKDREWLDYLLSEYPSHVVEFSVYDHCWGTEEGHQMVVWEVRQY